MSRFRWWALALLLLLKFGGAAGAEANSEPAFVLTFIEVRVEMRGHAAGFLRKQASALREHQASTGQIILMQEIPRPERFVVLERGSPGASTTGGGDTTTLTESLTDDLIAPPDRRLNHELDDVDTNTGLQGDARANFYVVTHVDITTPDRSRVETALRKVATAAHQADGNLGFEILQQVDRPNHFNLISAWLSESAFHTFTASAGAREFRQVVGPVLGSPYDERFYRRVD